MAQKTVITLIDDLTGDGADETVRFALDGASYEIDLSEENAERLRVALAPFIGSARRSGGRATPARRTDRPAPQSAASAMPAPKAGQTETRKASSPNGSVSSIPARTLAQTLEGRQQLRTWGRKHYTIPSTGRKMGANGRFSSAFYDAYDAAHQSAAKSGRKAS